MIHFSSLDKGLESLDDQVFFSSQDPKANEGSWLWSTYLKSNKIDRHNAQRKAKKLDYFTMHHSKLHILFCDVSVRVHEINW